MKKRFNIWEITCQQATFLTSKKEEGKLSIWERVQLYLHLKTCGPCRSFTSQVGLIKNHLHSFKNQSWELTELRLSDQSKSVIRQKINTLLQS